MKWPKDSDEQIDELGGNNKIMLGYVWPSNKTAFPDFFKESTKKWWKNEIKKHYETVPFDGYTNNNTKITYDSLYLIIFRNHSNYKVFGSI